MIADNMHNKMLGHRKYTDFLRILISVLFLFACAATITWLVYVIEYSDNKNGEHVQQYTIAFQAVVISVLLYATGHHGVTMLKRYILRGVHKAIDNIEKDIENKSISIA